jgi:hypothetical protein
MSGPDLTNNLVGVLMRFRNNAVAITSDVEHMFYQFRVTENHRDYIRLFWYQDNDFSKPTTFQNFIHECYEMIKFVLIFTQTTVKNLSSFPGL